MTLVSSSKVLWRSRWGVVRLAIAGVLLWVFLVDNPARLTRLHIASMPEFDYLAEIRRLRWEKRYGEALVVADAGLEVLTGRERHVLAAERERVIAERDSYLRRASDFASGALRGTGRTTESLLGAITADMFVVGDVRDLVVQGYGYSVDREMDRVIIALSAVGLLTTIAPEIDWVAGLLKVTRKAGALSKKMAKATVQVCEKALKGKEYGELTALTKNVAFLSHQASPAGAIRLLQHIDDPRELTKVTDFVRRNPDGAFTLHVAGEEGIDIVKSGSKEAKEALRQAAKKGHVGVALLRSVGTSWRRPHPLVRLLKPLYKGNIPMSVERMVADYLDPYGFLVVPLLSVWVLLELALFVRRYKRANEQNAVCLSGGTCC